MSGKRQKKPSTCLAWRPSGLTRCPRHPRSSVACYHKAGSAIFFRFSISIGLLAQSLRYRDGVITYFNASGLRWRVNGVARMAARGLGSRMCSAQLAGAKGDRQTDTLRQLVCVNFRPDCITHKPSYTHASASAVMRGYANNVSASWRGRGPGVAHS